MKTMTIWQRLHTALAALIALLLIGVSIAWWVENTRAKTQSRSDPLMKAGDRIRRNTVPLGDCLRWRTPPAPRPEQKKRVEELNADVLSSTTWSTAQLGRTKPAAPFAACPKPPPNCRPLRKFCHATGSAPGWWT